MRKISIDGIDVFLDKKIGEGNFSMVYNTSNPRTVAKVTHKSNEKGFRAAQNEASALSKLKGENIIGFKGSKSVSINNQPVVILLLENCSSGSLIDLLTTLPK
jgi:serine/threonine protein kinase